MVQSSDAAERRHLGVVEGERGAVAALLVEPVGARHQPSARAELEVAAQGEQEVLGVGGLVDRAALIGAHYRIAVGVEGARLGEEAGAAEAIAVRQVALGGAALAAFERDVEPLRVGRAGEELDHPSERCRSPRARPAAAHHLDSFDRDLRHAAPVHPAAERVVERHAVEQHHGTARAAGADASKRNTLGRGVRHHRAGAPEQAETRYLPQRVVHREGRRGEQLVGFEHRRVSGNLVERLLDAARRHHHDLLHRRRRLRRARRRCGSRGLRLGGRSLGWRRDATLGQGPEQRQRRREECRDHCAPPGGVVAAGFGGSAKKSLATSTLVLTLSTVTDAAGVPPVRIWMECGRAMPSTLR